MCVYVNIYIYIYTHVYHAHDGGRHLNFIRSFRPRSSSPTCAWRERSGDGSDSPSASPISLAIAGRRAKNNGSVNGSACQ